MCGAHYNAALFSYKNSGAKPISLFQSTENPSILKFLKISRCAGVQSAVDASAAQDCVRIYRYQWGGGDGFLNEENY